MGCGSKFFHLSSFIFHLFCTFAPAFAQNAEKMPVRTISHFSFFNSHLAKRQGPFVYRLGREIFIL